MSINNTITNISTYGNCIVQDDSTFTKTFMSCDEHIYELINASVLYNQLSKAGYEVQLKHLTKSIEKIIHGIILRKISHYNMIEIYHILKSCNNEKLLNLFTNNVVFSHLEGISVNSTEVEDYLEDSKKEFNKIIKIKLIKNEI